MSASATTRRSLLLMLSLAAGCTDAIAFLKAGIFPANMTGNSVVLAVSAARLNLSGLALAGLALCGFCLGAAAGSRALRTAPHAWSRRTTAILFAAGALVAACTLAALLAPRLLSATIVMASAAMGLQSAAVQWLGIPGVATVFMTGTLTTAVSRLVNPASAKPPDHPWLPASTFLCYLAGAFLGGLQSHPPFFWLGLLPALLLLAAAATAALTQAETK